MKRCLFTALAVLSLILCFASAFLWQRSYFIRDALFWGNRRLSLEVESNYGRLEFTHAGPQRSQGIFWDCFSPNELNSLHDEKRDTGLIVWLRRSAWGSQTWYEISVPYWLLVTSFAIVSIAVPLHMRHFRQQRKKQGLCIHCGYDVRATPDHCPECGKLTNQDL